MPEPFLLTIAGTGFAIAFLHAAIPTHWLPFVLTGRAQEWSRARTLLVTAVAGAGHVVVTAIIGALVIWGGSELLEHAGHDHTHEHHDHAHAHDDVHAASDVHVWFHLAGGGVLVAIGLFYLFRQFSGRGHVHLFGGHHHEHDHAAHEHEAAHPLPTGPHGGQTIDTGHGLIEARMSGNDADARVQLFYFERPGVPVPPPEPGDMRLEILRPDGTQQAFHFTSAGDHLASAETVATPHEFTAMLDLRHGDHVHRHELIFCAHAHPAHEQGVHAPADADKAPAPVARKSDWAAFVALFAMLTFSPCEGFVPVYISGIQYGWLGFGVLTLVLLIGSVTCMVLFTWLSMLGLQRISLGGIRRYESGLLGLLLCLLGVAMAFAE